MGSGVRTVEGSNLPIWPRGRAAWPFPRPLGGRSGSTEVARGPQGATSHPSGPCTASPRGPRPTATWREERVGWRPRLNRHQCATPQPSRAGFNAVRADVRRSGLSPACRRSHPIGRAAVPPHPALCSVEWGQVCPVPSRHRLERLHVRWIAESLRSFKGE